MSTQAQMVLVTSLRLKRQLLKARLVRLKIPPTFPGLPMQPPPLDLSPGQPPMPALAETLILSTLLDRPRHRQALRKVDLRHLQVHPGHPFLWTGRRAALPPLPLQRLLRQVSRQMPL